MIKLIKIILPVLLLFLAVAHGQKTTSGSVTLNFGVQRAFTQEQMKPSIMDIVTLLANKAPTAPSSSCRTLGGQTCLIPFEYRGTTYNSCTNVDNGGVDWCATSKDSTGHAYNKDIQHISENNNTVAKAFPWINMDALPSIDLQSLNLAQSEAQDEMSSCSSTKSILSEVDSSNILIVLLSYTSGSTPG
ncbi:MMP2 [Lepeophtheirus salmonis]|uniref:MMP2 n=1 Tax=Lepeophtheirus salmonis TaxID=72036 RepID=A0A7R8CHL1_LEPSM|nr:MMP2 [Lepeophtheirus salmonis]CAF2825035.1 MMP2 [Lepeophtheirus salmonis]